MSLLLVAIAIPFGAWMVGLNRLFRASNRAESVLQGSLALGFSMGAGSCLYFLWIRVAGNSSPEYWIMESLLLALALGAIMIGWNRPVTSAPTELSIAEQPPAGMTTRRILLAAFLMACVIAVTYFALQTYRCPAGYDDAITIWNLHARILFLSPDGWQDRLTDEFTSHPDYPLLVPASIARFWTACGEAKPMVTSTVALLLSGATLLLCYSLVAVMRGTNQGLLAGLTLLATSFFVKHAASQYADIPLSFFILAGLGLTCLHYDRNHDSPSLLILAGFSAGLAAWTKNEGMLFVVALLVSHGGLLLIRRGPRSMLRDMRWTIAGLAPVLLTVMIFKLSIESSNDLLREQNAESLSANLTDISRYTMITRAYFTEFISFAGIVTAGLVLLWWLWKKSEKPSGGLGRIIAVGALITMLTGFFMVYMTTYLELDFHLGTSLQRLFLQLWPSAIVLFYLTLATPEEVIARNGNEAPIQTTN